MYITYFYNEKSDANLFVKLNYKREGVFVGPYLVLEKSTVHLRLINMKLYKSKKGKLYQGDSLELLSGALGRRLKGIVDLIITSPPFPLNKKKKYGNETGGEYLKWFNSLVPIFADLLSEEGSLVIEIGNSWEPRRPVQSLLHLESLLSEPNNHSLFIRIRQLEFNWLRCFWENVPIAKVGS